MSLGRAAFKKKLEAAGAKVSSTVTKATTHLVCTEEEYEKDTKKVVTARGRGIPIVSEDWVDECIKSGADKVCSCVSLVMDTWLDVCSNANNHVGVG